MCITVIVNQVTFSIDDHTGKKIRNQFSTLSVESEEYYK